MDILVWVKWTVIKEGAAGEKLPKMAYHGATILNVSTTWSLCLSFL